MKYLLLILFALVMFRTARIASLWLMRRNVAVSKTPQRIFNYSDLLWPLAGIVAGILAWKFIPE
jgi:hypothetical protein